VTLPPFWLFGDLCSYGSSEEGCIARKRHTAQEVIGKLREAVVLVAQGQDEAALTAEIAALARSMAATVHA